MTSPASGSPLTVRPVSAAEHLAFLDRRWRGEGISASFLQTPAWGAVKSEWRHQSLGFFDGELLVGTGLVLLRQVPRVKRYLAYLPEGPDLDWADHDLARWLTPLAALVIVSVSIFIFTRGMGHYRATGSSRYLALGHRR